MAQSGERIPLTGTASLFIVRVGKALSDSYTVSIKREEDAVVAFGVWKRIKR